VDDHEANYLRQCIRELEQANRRWKAVVFSLLVLLTIFIILGGVGLVGVASNQRAREARMAAEEARRAAEMAAQQAQQARLAAQAAEQPKVNPEDGPGRGGLQITRPPSPQPPPGKAPRKP
jgi:type II secretory pathway pseudopilin PulG